MAGRHFIDIWHLDHLELREILDMAHAMKAARKGWPKGRVDDGAPLEGHTLAMLFEKASTRTRFSFDMAMRQLGGSSITATAGDMQLGRGETIEDTARVLSRYVDASTSEWSLARIITASRRLPSLPPCPSSTA